MKKSDEALICPNSFSDCKVDYRLTEAFSKMFTYVYATCILDAFIKYRIGTCTYINTYSVNTILLGPVQVCKWQCYTLKIELSVLINNKWTLIVFVCSARLKELGKNNR